MAVICYAINHQLCIWIVPIHWSILQWWIRISCTGQTWLVLIDWLTFFLCIFWSFLFDYLWERVESGLRAGWVLCGLAAGWVSLRSRSWWKWGQLNKWMNWAAITSMSQVWSAEPRRRASLASQRFLLNSISISFDLLVVLIRISNFPYPFLLTPPLHLLSVLQMDPEEHPPGRASARNNPRNTKNREKNIRQSAI